MASYFRDTTLVDRYLRDNGWTHGIMVIAFFDAPAIPMTYRPKWKTPQKARSYLERQAMSITHESSGLKIGSFVLDVTIA